MVRPAFLAPSDDKGRIYQENSGETGRENNFVMPGFDPGIHQSSLNDFSRWITGSSPVMTTLKLVSVHGCLT
jgi:hypothetical protein